MLRRALACAVIAVFTACTSETAPTASSVHRALISADGLLLARAAARAGIDTTGAQEVDGHLVVENDIAIAIAPKQSSPQIVRTINPQARLNVALRADYNTVGSVRINLNALQSRPAWLQGTRRAINNWNALRGSAIRITETTGSANITVSVASLPYNVYARAQLPTSSFSVGSWIWVNAQGATNPYATPNPSATEQVLSNISIVMSHELGHTFGMLHTNSWQSEGVNGELIPGTTNTDASSVLWNSISPSAYWAGFSADDIFGIRSTWLGYGPSSTATNNTLYWSPNDPEAVSYKVVRWYWFVPPNTNEQYPEGLGYSEVVATLPPNSSSYYVSAGTQGCDRYNPHYLYGIATEYSRGIVTRVLNVSDCFAP